MKRTTMTMTRRTTRRTSSRRKRESSTISSTSRAYSSAKISLSMTTLLPKRKAFSSCALCKCSWTGTDRGGSSSSSLSLTPLTTKTTSRFTVLTVELPGRKCQRMMADPWWDLSHLWNLRKPWDSLGSPRTHQLSQAITSLLTTICSKQRTQPASSPSWTRVTGPTLGIPPTGTSPRSWDTALRSQGHLTVLTALRFSRKMIKTQTAWTITALTCHKSPKTANPYL